MNYEKNKKRLPKKKTDISIMKCILRAINDHFSVTYEDVEVSEQKFNGYFDSLAKMGIIVKVGDKYRVEDYNIHNQIEYKRFLRNKAGELTVGVNTGIVSANYKIAC